MQMKSVKCMATKKQISEIRREAGKKGGLSTKKKYGIKHFSKLGLKTLKKYGKKHFSKIGKIKHHV
mgnify:CR=1 FL=1